MKGAAVSLCAYRNLPGLILCKTHARASHAYANGDGLCTPDVQRSTEPCVEICILLHQYAREYIV